MVDETQQRMDLQEEAVKFLERDFNQCFAQMRHYDGHIWDICKFAFAGYTALLGIAIGAYQYSLKEHIDLIPAAIGALAVGVLLGLMMFVLTVRNRMYFVLAARYINEHRKLFLDTKPLGFQNAVGMPTDPTRPPYVNPRSSQAWVSTLVGFLNSALFAALVIFALNGHSSWIQCVFGVIAFIILLIIQLLSAYLYFRSKEKRGTTRPSQPRS